MEEKVLTDERAEEDSFLKLRLNLAVSRIREIAEDRTVQEPYRDFFETMTAWILRVEAVKEEKNQKLLREGSIEELMKLNRSLYEDLLGGRYETSYGNPAYAVKQLGQYGQALSFLYAEMQGLIVSVFEKRIFDETILLELFLEVYNMFEGEILPDKETLKRTFYWYVSDYSDDLMFYRTRELVDPSVDFAVRLIEESDLTDLRYLYRFGEYITENELETARFLNTLPEEEIERMAATLTEGYRIGFLLGRKPIDKKKTVNIIYHLGFERMLRAIIRNFRAIDFEPIITRYAIHVLSRRSYRVGFSGAIPNQQYEYDHKNDIALILDEDLVQRRLRALQVSYEKLKVMADVYGGPAWIETFGEAPFEPVFKPENLSLSPHQRKLSTRYSNESGQITNRYLPGDEVSFTCIDYPLPEIGENYPDIFREIVRINTLDNATYRVIQEKLIDALNQGTSVHVKGSGENQTDLTIQLYPLTDPAHQTIFENCLADVNIPVGEVFTSPVLKGTKGILHVSQVYLEGLKFKNLKIELTDGMITNCSVTNFETEEENREFLKENLLYHHDTLPIGEFAIGTNTTAYTVSRKYGIEDKLPILIAEKMGPHFAMGDTCYSWCEDNPVYNPDGKEIVARDNEVSILRKKDVSRAYFNCHTDITIPYDELGSLIVNCADGRTIELIRDGRFVLPGCEELNHALDEA